jgi:transcriptional regulator with XRE-family HTH domain
VQVRKLFARNISRLRSEKGLTQEILSSFAQIDRSYLQRLESGAANPTLEVLFRLKKALKCSWSDLMQGME